MTGGSGSMSPTGFEKLTEEIRQIAAKEKGIFLGAQHVRTSMKVFINPVRVQ